MANKDEFIKAIKNGYTFKGETIKIGAGMRHVGNTIVRSLLGSLGLGGRSKSSTKSWF